MWFKTDEGQLKIYYDDESGTPSAQWVDAGGGGTGIARSDLSVGAEGTASGDGSLGYDDTTGIFTYTPPVIPAAQVQSDWNATTGLGVILNKPSIPTNTNTTYSQSSVASAANVNLRLTGSDSTNDDILVTAGNNVTFTSVTASGFTINSTGGGGSGNQGNDSVAVGSICIWSGTVANIPTGWSLCDGQNNTVDLRDKFIIGAKQDDGGVAKTNVTGSLSQVGGSKDAIVVSHSHTATVTDPGHNHTLTAQQNIGDYTDNGSGPDQRSAAATITSNSNTTGISVSNSTTGSSGTNANLPPYYALCYIQKTTAGGASFSLSVAPPGTASGGGALSYNNTTGVFSFTPAEQTTIIGNADNRIITGSATAGTLNGESNLTFDGSTLAIGGNVTLGASATSNITFQGKVNSDLDPMANNTYDLGQVGNVWKEVFATTLTATTTNTGVLETTGGGGGTAIHVKNGGDLRFENAGNTGHAAIFCDNGGQLKTNARVHDASGNLREIFNNTKTAAYTLVADDTGEMINTNSNCTIPQNVFSTGQAVTIYNNTTNSDITITQGTGVTMYLCGQATTGNRTLAKTGICTVVCVSTNTFVISGAGLT